MIKPPDRPNILILMTDQHRADLMGPDNPWQVRTPFLDRLLGQGVNFTHAYCNSPICAPSRMSMMTGLHTHRHHCYDNGASLASDIPTFAHALTAVGYETVLCARMHFNGADVYHGFERRLATDMNNPIEYSVKPAQWPGCLSPTFGGVREPLHGTYEVSDCPTLGYDDYVCDQACEYLEQDAGGDRPFLLLASFYGPHPMVANREVYRPEYEAYLAQDLQERELTEAEFDAMPAHEKRKMGHGADRAMVPNGEAIRRFRAEYFSRVTYTDALMGRVMDRLESQGLAENTVVIYVSDHGEQMGEHGLIGKSTFYEGTLRVPLIVSMPDRRRGTVEHNVQLVDLLPTLCGLAGRGPVEHEVDGRSLLPSVRAPTDDTVFSEFHDWHAWRPIFMVKRGPWKFCHYPGEQDFLFNLDEDPGETRNLAIDDEAGPQLAAMRELLFTRWDPPAIERTAHQRQAMRREILAATMASRQTKQRIRASIERFRDEWNEPWWDGNVRQGAHESFLD
jgi:choline-sulfatase